MHATKRIAVAGGTGCVGHHVVDVLAGRGHDVVTVARATGVDVITGAGLDEVLRGVDVVVDATGSPSPDPVAATAFFTTAARNLQAAAQRAGVGRLVVVSIIGADRFAGGYVAAKAEQERVLRAGPVPVDVLRSGPFHELIERLVAWGTQDGVARIRESRARSVAARTVAEALADLADGSVAATDLREVAGPREEQQVELARLLVSHRDLPLKVEGYSDPDEAEHFEGGALLPGPGARLAGPTFEEWLEAP